MEEGTTRWLNVKGRAEFLMREDRKNCIEGGKK